MNRKFAKKENSIINKHKNMFNFIQVEFLSRNLNNRQGLRLIWISEVNARTSLSSHWGSRALKMPKATKNYSLCSPRGEIYMVNLRRVKGHLLALSYPSGTFTED